MWEYLKYNKKCNTHQHRYLKGTPECFSYSLETSRSIIKAPDWLTALGNSNTDCHKYHIYFWDNSNAGKGDICSIYRHFSVMTQRIIHGNLHDCHGYLVDAGSHSQCCNRFHIFYLWAKHGKPKFHFTEFYKIYNNKQTWYKLSDYSRPCGSFDSPVKCKNK